MDHSREAEYLSTAFLAALLKRETAASEWNQGLAKAIPSRRKRIAWLWTALRHTALPPTVSTYGSDKTLRDRIETLEHEWRAKSGRRRASIPWALNDTMSGFWAGGLFKVAGDAAQMMSPLLVKALIQFSQEGELTSL